MSEDTKCLEGRFERQKRRCSLKRRFEAAHSLLDLHQSSSQDMSVSTGGIQTYTSITQTEMNMKDIHLMEDDIKTSVQTIVQLKTDIDGFSISQESFKNSADKTRFYTGLPDYVVLLAVYNLVESHVPITAKNVLSKWQQFILVFLKLRLHLPVQDLAYRFGVSHPTISRTFHTWINAMYIRLKCLIKWPEREILKSTMPMEFRKYFGTKVVSIIDCFEVFIDKPSNLQVRAQTYSAYKSHNTIKFLISIVPQGSINFISKAWGGRTSDNHITENSGYLDKLLPGDTILADRGFTIEEAVRLSPQLIKLCQFALLFLT